MKLYKGIIIFMFMVFLFSFIDNGIYVKAASSDSTQFPSNVNNGGGSGGSGGSCTINTSNGRCGYEGVRFTWMTTNSASEKSANYYFFPQSIPGQSLGWLGWNDGEVNKVDYLKGRAEATVGSSYKVDRFQSLKFRSFWSPPKTVGTWNLGDLVNSFDWSKESTQERFKNDQGVPDYAIYYEALKQVLETVFKLTPEQLDDDEYINDHWLVVEPLEMVKYKGKLYYGTEYELGTLNYSATNPIYKTLGRLLPCTSIVTGSIAKSRPDAPGVSSSAYFDGTLTFVDLNSVGSLDGTKTVSEVCSSNSTALSSEYVTSSYGTGIGLIWGGMLLEDDAPTCEKINDNYPSLKVDIEKALSVGNLNVYENKYKTGLSYKNSDGKLSSKTATLGWYVDNCIDTSTCVGSECPSTKVDCTPVYNIGSCLGGDIVKYSDESKSLTENEYWNSCVFSNDGSYSISTHKNSKTSTSGSLSYYDSSLGSQYCEVFCTENLNASFETSINPVYAGQFFTWENHTVSGSRTCKTKSIDWTSYTNDVNTANYNTETAYVNWQLEIKKAANIASHATQISSSSCSCIYSSHGNDCCTASSVHSYSCGCGDGKADSMSCCDADGKNCACGDSEPDSMSCSCGYVCDAPNNTRYDLYTASAASFKLITSHGNVSNSWAGTNWCSDSETPKTIVPNLESVYEANKNIGIGLTTKMSLCYTWNDSNLYNLNPTAKVSYSDDTNYSYSNDLITSTVYEEPTIINKCETITAPNYTSCSGNNCFTSSTVKKCDYNNETRAGTSTFSLEDGIFQYVLKSNNMSINVNEINKDLVGNKTINYIDLLESNFPVSYAAKNGIHDTLDLEYYNLGHMKGSSTTDIDNILLTSSTDINKDYKKWDCNFTVASNLITGTKPGTTTNSGINLIYRPIDLDNPFPSMTGTGRTTGTNWCNSGDCSNTNQTVKDYITNNRGVTTDDIYNEEPMYTFILTPSVMKEIKKYNKQNNYAEYTGTLDDNPYPYDFKCKTGYGTECISDYVTYLINLTNATGTCVNESARSTSAGSTFETCR